MALFYTLATTALANGQGTNITIKHIDTNVGFSTERPPITPPKEREVNVSDQDLRKLERSRNDFSLDEEVTMIRKRYLSGELEGLALEVAVVCGHAATSIAIERPQKEYPYFAAWVNDLLHNHQKATKCASIVAANQTLQTVENLSPDYAPTFRASLLSVAQCFMRPTSTNIGRCKETAYDLSKYIELDPDRHESLQWALHSLSQSLETAINDREVWYPAAQALLNAAYATSEEEVKNALCNSLIPWALGYKDPLLDLVAQLEATPAQD